MRKLFFSAALAFVAINSAPPGHAITFYTVDPDGDGNSQGYPINCNGNNITCVVYFGVAFIESSYPQTIATEEQLEDEFFN